jgi:CcmD family protein
VMAVVVVILLGLFIYLFSLDKKISKLEQNKKE